MSGEGSGNVLTKLGVEIAKEDYINGYMKKFKQLIFLADYKKELTDREKKLLLYEEKVCLLFFEHFLQEQGRAPDKRTLEEQVKRNFIQRAPAFARSAVVMDKENFTKAHMERIKKLPEMASSAYSSDNYNHILAREAQRAAAYFQVHEDYPPCYEELMISRSLNVVNHGLNELMNQFNESYHSYYSHYRKNVR